MSDRFFIAMIPPTATYQEKQVNTKNRKPIFYEPPELKDARAKLEAHLAKHRPDVPYEDGIRLIVRWCFPLSGNHKHGEYRTSRACISGRTMRSCAVSWSRSSGRASPGSISRLKRWNDGSP